MNYRMTALKNEFHAAEIVSVHYFEYSSDFTFSGESHDFWEFLYVDKGELEVTAGSDRLTLHKGEVIFHRPGEFHALAANGTIAPNLVVISFQCQDPAMAFFERRILKISESSRNLLAQILSEARAVFDGPLDDPYQEFLIRRRDSPFGGEQLIRLYLEQFLIQLYRTFSSYPSDRIPEEAPADTDKIYREILLYFEQNIRSQLTIKQICKDNLIGRSQLKKLFSDRTGAGVIHQFTAMKIEAAKELIRTRQMNFTQIADYLGYTSVHYFCRQFKQYTGMTPSEYTSSVKRTTDDRKRLF